MALGERFRSGGAGGIAKFLSEHQSCDAGFDVRRDDLPGSGKLTITCQGCGSTVTYNAAEVGDITPFDMPEESPAKAANGTNGHTPEVKPPVLPERDRFSGARPSDPGPLQAQSGLPSWLAPLAIALVIAAGVAMILIGLSRDEGEQQTAVDSAPTETEAPADTPPDEPEAPATPPPADEPKPDPEPSNLPAASLDQRSFGAFSIGVPAGWEASRDAEGATLTAPGSTAQVTVLAGQSDLGPLEFARQSAGFLQERHPDGSVGSPKPLKFEGRPAARSLVTYPGGEEQATFISANGFVYALLKRVEGGAPADVEDQANAALASFDPN